MTEIPFDEELWDSAIRYRNYLRKMWDEVRFHSGGCECNLRDDWDVLMDKGVDKRSAELTEDGIVCLACRIEGIYEEAVGSEVFDDEAITEIKIRLGQHSVISSYYDENGKLHYDIVKREAVDPIDLDSLDEEDPSTD